MDRTLRALLERVQESLRSELTEMAQEAGRVRALLAESVGGLSQSFCGLAAQAEAQKQVLEKLLVSLGREEVAAGGERAPSMDAFIRECAQILRLLAADLDELSARANDSVAEMGGLAGHVSKSLAQLGEIEAISTAAQFLALNAQIEAARAGAAGQGFAVVASEVKQVARSSRELAERISEHVGGMRGSLDRVRARMNEAAAKAVSAARDSRDKVDGVLEELDGLGHSVSSGLAELGRITADVRETAARAVRALQFEDIIGQLVGTMVGRIERLTAVSAALAATLENDSPSRGLDLLARGAAVAAPVQQMSMDAGSVDLF